MRRAALWSLLAGVMLAGCAADGPRGRTDGQPRGAPRPDVCKSGDQAIADERSCLLDDAACYELASGQWCTGPRGNVCPAGSEALPAGTACPSGAACFRMGESLECVAG